MQFRRIFSILLLALFVNSCGTPASPVKTGETASDALPAPQTGEVTTGVSKADAPYSQNIRFEHLSLEEGLSQSMVTSILQDRTGFLWIGTQDGLDRYDGYNFTVYKPDSTDPASLSDRWITALAEDDEGYLWVGTRLGGLNRYNPLTGEFKRFPYGDELSEDGMSGTQITALYVDKTGIWIGTVNGLNLLNPETNVVTNYRSSESATTLSSSSISAIFKDSHGTLWVGTSNAGVNIFDEKNKSFRAYRYDEEDDSSLSNNRVRSIAEDKNGQIWIGTGKGLNRFDAQRKTFTRFLASSEDPYSISDSLINIIHLDRSGGLWIGTNNGLDRYDEQLKKFIHHQYQPSINNSLSNNMVTAIYEDRSNVIWVGTAGGGLNKYNRQQDKFAYFRSIPDQQNGLSSNFVYPIVEDKNGFIWIGTDDGGLNRFDPLTDQFLNYKNNPNDENSMVDSAIISLKVARDGTLWIGTFMGLERFEAETQTFKHYHIETANATTLPIYCIYEDRQHTLWVGTGRGLYTFDPVTEEFTLFSFGVDQPAPFREDKIMAITQDSNGNLWLGAFDNGLYRLNKELTSATRYKNASDKLTSLSNNSVMVIYQDTNGTLWVGTAGGGFNRYNPQNDTFSRFTEKNGLPNDVIYGILEDEDENLWISTNFGLSRFNIATQTFRNFTASDGLQSNEFNQNAFAKSRNGFLYFGGINGFNVFKPSEIKNDPAWPPVVLTGISSPDGLSLLEENQTSEYLKEVTITWPQNSFEFEFAAFAFQQPGKNQYSYMLEGFDESWNQVKTKRIGRYTNLPGGTYTLRLRGANSDGVWNQKGQSIRIVVVPPFWETWWFRILMLFGLGITIAGGLRWRVKSVENRNRDLERVVQKRTADLEKRTREIEALYQADEKILRNVTFNQVFQTLVDVSVSLLKADRSVVFVWNEEQHKILPRVSHGFRPETLAALRYEEGEGMVGQAMKTGEPVIVSDLKIRELRADIQTVIRAEGIQSFAHFPIIVDGKVTALFNVGYTRPNALNEDNIRLFTALVQRASLSIANMELFEQTKDLAVMEERNRLARDLHDSAKQKAFAALAQLGTANGLWSVRAEGVQAHLREAETLVYEVIQELTFLIQEIYPIALQEKGLPTTLREYVYEWENRNDAEVNLTIRDERVLPLDTEQAIYRVIQEALANISRHSRAKRVDISLVYNADSLQVHIADDGCGFDMNQKAKGLGFRSMRDRINSVRGNIQMQSAPGQGTRLIIQLPIKQGAGEKV
jgi:ligand-binding sensor domain-containing protein/signal transduction histidine kinase